jgi:HSP20 family protein
MAIKDLLPWNRSSEKNEIIPIRNQTKNELERMDQPWDQWMNELWRDPFSFPFTKDLSQSFSPAFDLSESDTEIIVSADIPGLDVKDFTINLESDHLVISGEKKMEKKEKDHTYTRIGRVYGSFRQHIPINARQIDENKIQAVYKDGVLRIKLQKKEKSSINSRKIPIKSS